MQSDFNEIFQFISIIIFLTMKMENYKKSYITTQKHISILHFGIAVLFQDF